MRNTVQVIPLAALHGQPVWWRLWCHMRKAKLWHWCLAIALCHVLAGSSLLACSVHLAGISAWLVMLGIMGAVFLLFPGTRAQPNESLVPIYFAVLMTALVRAFYVIYS